MISGCINLSRNRTSLAASRSDKSAGVTMTNRARVDEEGIVAGRPLNSACW